MIGREKGRVRERESGADLTKRRIKALEDNSFVMLTFQMRVRVRCGRQRSRNVIWDFRIIAFLPFHLT